MIDVANKDRFDHESPRGHSGVGGQRLPLRPADWQPSPFHGDCWRTNPSRYGFGKEERRHYAADARVHQATIRLGPARVSTSSGVNGNWRGGLKNEPLEPTIAAAKAVQACQYGHLGPHMPRCSTRQEAPLLAGWQLLNSFQVHFDAGRQRLPCILEGIAVGGDIEVRADRVPLRTALLSVALEFEVHDSSLNRSVGML